MIKIISDNAETLLEQYHQHLAANGRLSDATIGNHIAVVRDFASWYESYSGEYFRPGSVPTYVLMPYQTTLRERGLNSVSIKRQIAILNSFFEWVTKAAARKRST
ncbi:MAG TPA: site-specific integrase [Oceanobacillus sp.]|nr:site-specific integrase [Oceanobacillus sp.]